jgi:predicted nucleic acid-binding protein
MALPISLEEEKSIPRICLDPDDDRVIACAVVGEADVLLTATKSQLRPCRIPGYGRGKPAL